MNQTATFLRYTLATYNGVCMDTVRRPRIGLEEGGQETSCGVTFAEGGFGPRCRDGVMGR